MAPKDRDSIIQKSKVIYIFKWERVECDVEYIGESSRAFEERFKDHFKDPPLYMIVVTSQVTLQQLTI